jgi:uncharacterized membrane protein YraQ (UPF0718 family)
MELLGAVVDALGAAGSMGWQILWPLVLGFTLSGVIQAVVRRERVTALLAGDGPRSLAWASAFGAASSSCSYAAVALARSLVRKGASFTAAMAFEIAATNLVLELGIVLALVLGWRFTLAEFVGGPLIIVLVALMFRVWMRGRVVEAAREQAERGLAGSMEGHAAMDMSVQDDRPFLARLFSGEGFTAVASYFVMDWAAVLRDVVLGLLVAGAFAAWVPTTWLQHLFLDHHPVAAAIWGPVVGPLIAVVSFVCSVGNVPLAAVLWNGGISFGGVVSFLFADLLIVPILLIYRKYYGTAATVRIAGTFYVAMVAAGYVVELVFTALGLVPAHRHANAFDGGISWNYTTWLDIASLLLAAALLARFSATGGWSMLRMMGGAPEGHQDHGDDADHTHHHAHEERP